MAVLTSLVTSISFYLPLFKKLQKEGFIVPAGIPGPLGGFWGLLVNRCSDRGWMRGKPAGDETSTCKETDVLKLASPCNW